MKAPQARATDRDLDARGLRAESLLTAFAKTYRRSKSILCGGAQDAQLGHREARC